MNTRRFKSQRPPALPENPLGWLTTFNDMITLLMVFFVLLFSMGRMDVARFKHFLNGLQSGMGVLYEGRNAAHGVVSNRQLAVPDHSPVEKALQNFRSLAGSEGLEAEYTPAGVRITLRDKLLFRSGSAKLTRRGVRLLDKICTIVKPMHRLIRIEGHTDNRSIGTARYPSNWELSTARAVSVVTYLIHHGGIAPELLSAAGYGSSKPRAPNDTPAHRALNRRVAIILGRRVSGPDAKIGGYHPTQQTQ